MQLRTATSLVLALCLPFAACGGSGDCGTSCGGAATTRPVSTTARISSSTTQVVDAEDAIRQVAERWYRHALRLTQHPSVSDPALDRYLTPELAERYRAKYQALIDDDLHARPPVQPADIYYVDQIDIRGLRATFRECVVDDYMLIRESTGEVVNDDVQTTEVESAAVQVDGQWRMESQKTVSNTKGVAGCALSE